MTLEHRAQTWDANLLSAKRIHRRGSFRVGCEAVAGINRRELIGGARGDRSLRVRRAIERVVVVYDDDPVA